MKGKGVETPGGLPQYETIFRPHPSGGRPRWLEKVATLCSWLFVQKFGSYHPEAIHLRANYSDTSLDLFMTEKRGNLLNILQK